MEKNYYTIGEISRITNIKPHVIRYWEEKFKIIRPIRLSSSHRRYTRKDLENILKIKEMLYTQGYSLNGIKKLLNRKVKSKEKTELLKNETYSKETEKYKKVLNTVNTELKKLIDDLMKL